MRRFLVATCALLVFSSPSQADTARAQRIVSINLCLDGLLLKLVEPERINALYYLSANPQFSASAEQAKGFYLHHGLAEDIVPRNPDLILAGEYTSPDLKFLLKQLGLRVEIMALPRTLNDISEHIRHFGELTGNQSAAETMARELEQRLVALDNSPQKSAPIPAFWYSSNGVVVGGETLENELMTRAGFHNLALDKNIIGFKQLDLEELILAKPQAIIVEASDVQAFSLAQEYVQHPALGNLEIIKLPTTLSCIAPVAADAIQNLMQERARLAH